MRVSVVIPALDEEGAIGHVVRELLEVGGLERVVVADNGSTDRTAAVAREAGADVVAAPKRGYGAACLAGIDYLRRHADGPPDIVVFVDGDGSNVAAELPALVEPIESGACVMTIGARRRLADAGSLTAPQRFGNALATFLMRYMYGTTFTDLGPFRAVSWAALEQLGMEDENYGWTVEMQVKAAKQGVPVREVDVHNRSRIAGKSKVAGTVRGVVGAGYKILYTIYKYR